MSVRLIVTTLAACLLGGCQNKSAVPQPQAKAEGETKAAPESPPEVEAKSSDPPRSEPGSDLALRDPAWFRPDLWPGAKVASSGRTEADASGLFSSQVLLELPPGTTAQKCVDELTSRVKPHVPDLAPHDDPKVTDGRLTLRGSTETYRATIVCGEAKGVMRAYISYQWTKVPTSVVR